MKWNYYYKIDNKSLSTKIQKHYFNKGFQWIGTGEDLWFPKCDHYLIGICLEVKLLCCLAVEPKKNDVDVEFGYEKKFTVEGQLEFVF